MNIKKQASILLNSFGLSADSKGFVLNSDNLESVFKAKVSDLSDQFGFKNKTAEKIVALRESGFVENECEYARKNGIKLISYFDQDYPHLLKEISSAPLLLYVKGDASILNSYCLAVVGARKATDYGIEMAEKFSYLLSSLGLVIVSGLAYGIDTASHEAALIKGKTVAVVGTGLKSVYPKENKYLFDKIAEKGAVVSEFSLDTPVRRQNFPQRNRIITGLSKAVLVIEAALKSGALITAKFALEQNRDVFALPGPVNSLTSQGTNALIKDGAYLLESVDDVIENLNLGKINNKYPSFNVEKSDSKVLANS